ncbi:MAG: radical SAM protein [Slackia sp.]|nr:radical SAM protein [Slackia sp.]
MTEYGLQRNLIAIRPDSAYAKKNPGDKSLQSYMINESSAEILKLFSKGAKYGSVVGFLSGKYKEDESVVDEKVESLFNYLRNNTVFEVMEADHPFGNPFLIERFHNNRYPMRASIELTHRCNMKCRHCYGSYGSVSDCASIPLEEVNRLFEELSRIGVIGVELTGGEVSVYPYIAEAIESAFENGMEQVTLLTNGAVLPDDLLRSIARHKDRMTVQVDLHSLDDAYYEWFTEMPGVLGRVEPNIRRLIATGAKIIIGSIITPGNIEEVDSLAQWSFEHGASQFSPSLVVGIGRAKEPELFEALCFTDEESTRRFIACIQELYEGYPDGFVRRANVPDGTTRKNCGTIYQHVTIAPTGNVKICAMNSGDRIGFSFGNVFEESVESLYDRNAELIGCLVDLAPPGANGVCDSCDAISFCYGCIERGLEKAVEIGSGCAWYERIPEELKRRLVLDREGAGYE